MIRCCIFLLVPIFTFFYIQEVYHGGERRLITRSKIDSFFRQVSSPQTLPQNKQESGARNAPDRPLSPEVKITNEEVQSSS